MIEKTLVIIKPDGVMKGVVRDIENRYVDHGLRVVREQRRVMEKTLVEQFYQEHARKFFFEGLVLSMISGAVVIFILEGEDAIKKVRALNGATDPAKAELGTIRHDFRSAGGPFNTVHGSDGPEAAAREIALIFGATY